MTGLERRAWFTASKKHEFSRRSLFYNWDFAVPTAGRLKSNGPCLPSLPTRMGTADKKEKVTGPKLLKGSVPITPDKGIIKGARPGWSFGKEGRGEGSMRWASKCWGVYLLFVLLRFSFKCHTCMNSIWYNDILHYFKSAAKQQRPGLPLAPALHFYLKTTGVKSVFCVLPVFHANTSKYVEICQAISHFTQIAQQTYQRGSVPSGRRESFLTGFLRPHLLEVPRLVPFRRHLGGFPYFAVPNMAMNCLPHLLFVTRANTGRLKF